METTSSLKRYMTTVLLKRMKRYKVTGLPVSQYEGVQLYRKVCRYTKYLQSKEARLMNRNKNMLNVLMVTARYFPDIGGIEMHVQEIGPPLPHNGINITLLTTIPHALSNPLHQEMVDQG